MVAILANIVLLLLLHVICQTHVKYAQITTAQAMILMVAILANIVIHVMIQRAVNGALKPVVELETQLDAPALIGVLLPLLQETVNPHLLANLAQTVTAVSKRI